MGEGVRLLEESFGGKAITAESCGRSYAEEGKTLGKELGIGGTPTMVLSDGRVVIGARPSGEIRKLLDEAEREVKTAAKK
jgi:protein-disulfide isomerase